MRIKLKKRKLKIGVVIDQLLAGGVQLTAIEQVKHLRRLGHEAILIILMRKEYPTDFSYLVKNIPHQYLSDYYPSFLRRPIKFPIFSFFSTLHVLSPFLAPVIIQKGEYDLLISHGTTTCLTTQALRRIKRIPYLAVIHDPMVYILGKCYSQTTLKYLFPALKPLAKLIERSFVKEAEATLIVSRVHFNYIKKNYNLTPIILPPGCKTLSELPEKRGNSLLAFGRWQKEKNPFFLLELLKNIPTTDLVIAGSWSNQEDLKNFKEKIEAEKLGKRVKLIPYFADQQLKRICAQSRLWLHAHFESFGLAALEAAGHGLPIIMPRSSGATEAFDNGVHGFFPRKIELNEYKGYIQRLLKDERLAYQMGQAAWKIVKNNYSWEANVKSLLRIIKKALGTRTKPNLTIIEICHSKGTSLGGGDKLMEPIALRLAGKYSFTVVTSRIGARHWLQASLEKKMKILPQNRFDNRGDPIPVFLTYCLRMWQTYKMLKNGSEIDFLHSSTNILPDILPAYFIKRTRPQIIWVAVIHHLIPPPHRREGRFVVNIVSYLMQVLALWMLKNAADIIFTQNQELKKNLVGLGFPQDRLAVLGGGIEFNKISRFKPLHNTDFDGVILGRIHPAKGTFDAIPIWKQVTRTIPTAKLAIIGDGPFGLKQRLKKDILGADLTENVKLLGFLPYETIFTIMKNARVFLFLDHEAGWGLATAEAMACGLPIIGYDIGVLGLVFHKGFITIRDFNKHLFAKKIVRLLQDEKQHLRLAQAAFSQAKQLDWDQTTEKFYQILRQRN